MSVLIALPLSEPGHFRYYIGEAGKLPVFATEDLFDAVEELQRLGTGKRTALSLIAEARIYGSVEVAKDDERADP